MEVLKNFMRPKSSNVPQKEKMTKEKIRNSLFGSKKLSLTFQ